MTTSIPATAKLVDIVVTRTFDAPRELVFEAWTDPAHLMRWFSPNGATTPHASVDFRVGGEFRFCMRFPDGREAWAKGVYTELVKPERIVYKPYFTDADGTIVSPRQYGIDADRPSAALVTVTFEDLGGKTKLTLRHSVPEFFPARDQMRDGWTQMFEKLGKTI
jgi:uncharacterized protein YndB with AHSA1/START domain